MDLDLTERQRMVREHMRRFALRELAPGAKERDLARSFPYDVVPRLADLGVFGLIFPEDYGGDGADTVSYVVALEEIARADSSVAALVADQVGLAALPIYLFGNEGQRREWLPRLIGGEVLGSFALTEPGAGSDARSISTRARIEGDWWIIDGSKVFITNAGTALTAFVLVAAVTGERGDGQPEISALLVPTGAPGFSLGPPLPTMGWRASDTRPLFFNDCRVPLANLLGNRGDGLRQFLKTLDFGRIQIAAMSVGLAQAALDESVRYATSRVQFGKPISQFQAVQFKMADMAVELEAARLLTWKAAWLRDAGREFAAAASMAKLFASEVAMRAANHAVQIHGGYGLLEDATVNRLFRDAKVLEIGEGTSEIQRIIIARHLLVTMHG